MLTVLDLLVRTLRRPDGSGRRRRERLTRLLLLVAVILVAAGSVVGVPSPATARDSCPDVFAPPVGLPDVFTGLTVEPGALLSDSEDVLDEISRVLDDGDPLVFVRKVPSSTPAGVTGVYILEFHYTPGPGPDEEPFVAWVCLGGKVPNVRSMTLTHAADAIAAQGLVPEGGAEGSWLVSDLVPGSGEHVEFGTVVSMTAQPPTVPPPETVTPTPTASGAGGGATGTNRDGTDTSETTTGDSATTTDRGEQDSGTDVLSPITNLERPWPWLLVLVVLAGLAATGLVRRRGLRRPRHEPHVTTRVSDDLPSTQVTELPGVHRSHTVAVQTHRDTEHITLRTVPPTSSGSEGDTTTDQ